MSGVLATIDDFDENGKLKPGYRDKDGVWQRVDAQIGAVTENTRLAVDPTSPWASNWRAIQKEGHGG